MRFFRADVFTEQKNILMPVCWLLWSSAIILLEFYYRDATGVRLKIAYGQYLFFAVAIASGLLLASVYYRSIRERPAWPLLGALGFLLMAMAISAAAGITPVYGLRLLIIILLTSWPFLMLGMMSGSVENQCIITPFLSVSIACACSAVLLALTGPVQIAAITLENYLMGQRWAFFFIEANGFAGMLALGISTLLFKVSSSQSKREKQLLLLLFLPLLLGVLWKTNSRGSFLWIFITLLMYGGLALISLAKKNFTLSPGKFLLISIVSVIVLATIVIALYWHELSAFLRLNQADMTTGRMQIWLFYLQQFKIHPWFGFGFAGSDALMADFEFHGPYTIAGPLNVFIGILGESGLFGISALLILWGGAIWKAWRTVRRRFAQQDFKFHYAFFLMVILISLAAHQNGEWLVLRVTPFNGLFFFLIGAAWTLDKNDGLAAKAAVNSSSKPNS